MEYRAHLQGNFWLVGLQSLWRASIQALEWIELSFDVQDISWEWLICEVRFSFEKPQRLSWNSKADLTAYSLFSDWTLCCVMSQGTPLPQYLCACWSFLFSLGVMPSCALSQRRFISREKWAASWGESMTSRVSSLRWAAEALQLKEPVMTVRLSMTANCSGWGLRWMSGLVFRGGVEDEKPEVKPVGLMRLNVVLA